MATVLFVNSWKFILSTICDRILQSEVLKSPPKAIMGSSWSKTVETMVEFSRLDTGDRYEELAKMMRGNPYLVRDMCIQAFQAVTQPDHDSWVDASSVKVIFKPNSSEFYEGELEVYGLGRVSASNVITRVEFAFFDPTNSTTPCRCPGMLWHLFIDHRARFPVDSAGPAGMLVYLLFTLANGSKHSVPISVSSPKVVRGFCRSWSPDIDPSLNVCAIPVHTF